LEKTTRRGAQQSLASVNRKLELLSRILSMAVDYGMIQFNPCQRVRKFRLDNRRERYLSVDEEGRLMKVLLGRKAYLRPIIILALNTLSLPKTFRFCAGGAADISRWWSAA
jgi:site-specific recombinase XerC